MPGTTASPERIALAPGLEISRVVTGLWQVADMEREGRTLDPDRSAEELAVYAAAGFDTFDMADHYGSAEIIAGRYLAAARNGTLPQGPAGAPRAFTKWCPPPGNMTRDVVRDGIGRSLNRMALDRVDLMQFHWWLFQHPAYLDALGEMAKLRDEGRIAHIGLTNFDTDHLRLVVRHGCPIVSNQISFSLLDRRAAGAMTAFCLQSGVRLLAYGTLGGGFLSDRWVGKPEPTQIPDWSKSKYKRFIDVIGGWTALQTLLATLSTIARRHGVSVSNVATRWVLQQPAVAAVIIGARLGESEHRSDNLRLFSFALDATDLAAIERATAALAPVPGDCGDEYRKPPFLTASGDLSHHLDAVPKVFKPEPIPGRPGRTRVSTGSVWEPIAGYSRAVRVGDRIMVSGTTATHGSGQVVCPGDVAGQTVYILDKIVASVEALGGTIDDIVRTRVYLRDAAQWEPASRAHGRYFGDIRPANTLLAIRELVGDYEVEIDAEAVVN
jgi:aryl-alcohol dehydrogenase-like predicted oxidoreductase/enamine deaminase RidA (YjgF/YER057c/UK114 family)